MRVIAKRARIIQGYVRHFFGVCSAKVAPFGGRLLKKAHLLCCQRRSSVRRTIKSTPPSSLLDALHLDLFEQLGKPSFHKPIMERPGYPITLQKALWKR